MSGQQDRNQLNDDIDYQRHDPVNIIYKIGIYGWRKRCLYLLVLIVTVITIINLSLTIWIMHVMNFNLDGMGKLKITNKGVLLQGNAEFVKSLRAESIETRKGKELTVQSTANVTVNSRNESGAIVSQFVVGKGEIVSKQKVFKVHSNNGKELLYADKDEIRFGYDMIKFANDETTANFTGALQTEHVRAPPYKHLELHSPTRSVYLQAPEHINLNTKGGDIFVQSKSSASFESEQFVFDGKIIKFVDLPFVRGSKAINNINAKEVCICENGRLFAADSSLKCAATAGICN